MREPGDKVEGKDRTYLIEGVRGVGSFGTTYRASIVGSGHTVLLKELELRGLSDWKTFELFEREAAALRRLDHPRIPRYVDSFACEAGRAVAPDAAKGPVSFILVEEYFEGETLAEHLDARGSLSAPEVVRLFHSLLGVLDYLHTRTPPIIHRDVKPTNIVLDETGEPHLVDFGAVLDRIPTDSHVGSTTAGTLGYMPLEQAMGRTQPSSDLYALGMTIVVAATGLEPTSLPLDARTGKVMLAAIVGHLPPDVLRSLDAMLEPIAGQRVESARGAIAIGAKKPRFSRAFLVSVAVLAAVGAALCVALALAPPDAKTRQPASDTHAQPAADQNAWFQRIRPHCNGVEVEVSLRENPAPKTREGSAYTAACYALAGKIDSARRVIDDEPAEDRGWAASVVFNVAHPIADAGDDEATAPIMRFVLEYDPNNYKALYHAAMAEYFLGALNASERHIERFVQIYGTSDGWGSSGARLLAELRSPTAGSCGEPLFVNPEGRKVYRSGCMKWAPAPALTRPAMAR